MFELALRFYITYHLLHSSEVYFGHIKLSYKKYNHGVKYIGFLPFQAITSLSLSGQNWFVVYPRILCLTFRQVMFKTDDMIEANRNKG